MTQIVTLKKAAALATALASVKIETSTSVTLSIFSTSNVQNEVEAAIADIKLAVETTLEIQSAIYLIRALIGKANEGEINELLTHRAMLDKQLAMLNSVNNNVNPIDYDGVTAQREAKKNQDNTYSAPSLSVTIPTGDFIQPAIKQVKKARISTEDKLTQLNFTKTIELPDDVVKILTDFDLI